MTKNDLIDGLSLILHRKRTGIAPHGNRCDVCAKDIDPMWPLIVEYVAEWLALKGGSTTWERDMTERTWREEMT